MRSTRSRSRNSDGYSYGASGAVDNSGGVSVGGNNNAYPANATIDLTPAALAGVAGNTGVPVPGGTATADALGGITASIGAVSALAQTPAGVAKPGTTSYSIADVTLNLGSPLVGQLLGSVTKLLGGVSSGLGTLGGGLGVSTGTCDIGSIPTITLAGGFVTIDPSTATLSIDLGALLKSLGIDLNHLPANTDLLQYLITYLTSPSGLASALGSAITGLTGNLSSALSSCLSALPVLGNLLSSLLAGVNTLLATLGSGVQSLVTAITTPLGSALTSTLAPLGTVLKQILDIGVNVQPNGAAGTYTDALSASADQDTAPVAGQTVVRAIELNLLGKGVNAALANAAAGPSNPVTAVTSPSNSVSASNTAIPTGIPAGFDKQSNGLELPLVLLLVGLLMAGGGTAFYRVRVRGTHTK